MKAKTVLAIDIGAESGRVMGIHFDGKKLELEELHRFPNPTVSIRGTLHWDILGLWRDIQAGIEKGKILEPVSVGLDTWGVDFALLDAQGILLGNPVHYRDNRTEGMLEKAFSKVSREEIFAQTGIQFLSINTLYQMLSLVEARSPQLSIADTFLTIPDLLNYWLTGTKVCEFSNATTTQMFNPTTGGWATSILEKFTIPTHIFPEIVRPGTRLGTYASLTVIAPACHDTGSAVAAVPAKNADFAYISSGTWSLVGLEEDHPIINQAALAANVTNEGGVYGTYRLLKNVMGLWIFQQCRATWEKEGTALSYDALVEMALTAEPLTAFVNPDDLAFLSPGDHPRRIREMCQKSGQPVPETRGAIARLVLESLALAYRRVIEQLAAVSGQEVKVIHIVGGGSQNALLNQMTADATGIPVIAGPSEATVIGNALVQFIALGELGDIQEARQIVTLNGPLSRFEPQARDRWNDAYQQYKRLVG
jgi:rhamnulokinase